MATAFHLHRQARSQRARTLGMLLLELDADYGIGLRRAPDLKQACREAYGPAHEPSVVSLRELLGLRRRARMAQQGHRDPRRRRPHPSALRRVRAGAAWSTWISSRTRRSPRLPPPPRAWRSTSAPAPACSRRCSPGAASPRVIATDQDPRALACARANIERLRLGEQGRGRRGRSVPRARRAGGVQSAMGARAAQLAARARHLRSGEPDAQGLPRRDSPRTWHTDGEGWPIAVRSRRAPRACGTSRGMLAVIATPRRCAVGTHRCAALHPKASIDGSAARGARGRGDLALAAARVRVTLGRRTQRVPAVGSIVRAGGSTWRGRGPSSARNWRGSRPGTLAPPMRTT